MFVEQLNNLTPCNFVCLFVWLCCAACGMLVPLPGKEPRPSAEHRVLTTGLPGSSQPIVIFNERTQPVDYRHSERSCWERPYRVLFSPFGPFPVTGNWQGLGFSKTSISLGPALMDMGREWVARDSLPVMFSFIVFTMSQSCQVY